MLRTMLKSKIHRATVTGAELHYRGSIAIDEQLIETADLMEGEMVHILNINTGARFETYVIKAERNSGEIRLNGAAARLAHVGDQIIILSYAIYSKEELEHYKSAIVHVDSNNRIVT